MPISRVLALILLTALWGPLGGCDGDTSRSAGGGGPPQLIPKGSLPFNSLGDIWAEGTTIYLAGRFSGSVFIVDASDPDLPVEITRIQGIGFPQDVKVQNGVLYVTNEDGSGIGLRTYDVSNPGSPMLLGELSSPGVGNIHNVFVDGNYAYVASDDTSNLHVIDVTDPSTPTDVAQVPAPPGGRCHDMMARGGVCYGAFLGGGFMVINVVVPASPSPILTHNYPNSFTHNIWPSDDGLHVFTTDENAGGHMKAFDISDPLNVQEVGSYEAKPNIIIHNVIVDGPYAYIAYYVEGLHIVDVSDPTDMRKVASFDTYPGPDSDGFAGAWGVYPFTAPQVYVSDLNTGLYIFEFVP